MRPKARVPIVLGCSVVVAAAITWVLSMDSSDVDIVGVTGVTVDPRGQPVLIVAVCDHSLDRLYLDGKLPADHSVQAGDRTWTATSPATTTVEFPVFGDAPAGWRSSGAEPPMRPEYVYIAFAQAANHRREASQVSFLPSDLTRLGATEVLVGNTGETPKVVARSDFAHQVCR